MTDFEIGLENAEKLLTMALQAESQGDQCAKVAEALIIAVKRLDGPPPGLHEAQGLLAGVIFAALRDASARLWAIKKLEHLDDTTTMH